MSAASIPGTDQRRRAAADSPPSRGPARSKWRTFGLAAVVVFMVSLDGTVVVAAFPALRKHFAGASPADLSWALNGYTIVYAALLVTAGRLADRYGRKRCFLHGIALFTLASAGCAFAGSALWLAIARVVQAVGAALLTPSSLALILSEFPQEERQRAVSLWSAVGAFAAALGPLVGSALIEWASWPMIFLINLPVGIVAWWRGYRGLPESGSPEAGVRFDFAGTGLLILAVGSLAFGIVQAGEAGWMAPRTVGSLATGLALLAWFAWHAKGRKQGALDLELFSDRNFSWSSLATFVFGAAFSMAFLSFYLFMTGVWGYPQFRAGLAATPGPVGVIAVVLSTSGLAMRVGHRRLLVLGGILYAISNLWFYCTLGRQADYLGTWLPGQLLGAVAIGLILPTLTGAAVAGLKPGQFAVGNAVNAALRQLGGSLGVALTLAIAGQPGAGITEFRSVYACLGIAGILIAMLCLPISPDFS